MRTGQTAESKRKQYVALVILLSVTVILAGIALTKTGQKSLTVGQTPGYTQQSWDNAMSVPQSDNSNVEQSEPFIVKPTERILAAFIPNVLVRAHTATCPDAFNTIEISDDGGQTWESENVGESHRISAVERFVRVENNFIALIGRGIADCSLSAALVRDQHSQGSWESINPSGFWRINPIDPSLLNGPDSAEVRPGCTAVQISVGTPARIGVLCEDATIAVSADRGESWNRTAAPLVGVDSFLVTDASTSVLLQQDPECKGITFANLDPEMNVVERYCIPGVSSERGQTALAKSNDGTLWLWAGDSLVHSMDGGRSWE